MNLVQALHIHLVVVGCLHDEGHQQFNVNNSSLVSKNFHNLFDENLAEDLAKVLLSDITI